MAVTRRYMCKEVVPFAVMVGLECTNVVSNTLFKAATDRGMSYYVFVVYSYAIASLPLLPSLFFPRRSSVLPPLSSRIIGQLFLLGLIGSSCVFMGYKGIEYGSPTLASAMSNLIPAFTFILAIIFRMEKVAWRSFSSQSKIFGTMVSIGGALIVILYKGPSIIIFSPTNSSISYTNFLLASDSNWIIGGFLLGVDYFLTPVWYIIQAHVLKEYPAELHVTFFYSFFAFIISGAISFIIESNRAAWMPKLDISLAAILYNGLVGSCLANSVHAWVLRHKGPVYVAMFKPLSIAIAAAMGVIFLGDTLYLGSVTGAVVISLGFYAVMWGKRTEQIHEDVESTCQESSSRRIPLLVSSKVENT